MSSAHEQIGILQDLPDLNPCAVPFYPPLYLRLSPAKKAREEESKEESRMSRIRYSAQEILRMRNRPESRRRPKIDASLQFLLNNKPTSSRLPPGGKRSFVNTKLYTVNEETKQIEAKKTQEPSNGNNMKWVPVKTEGRIVPVQEMYVTKETPAIIPTKIPYTSTPNMHSFSIPLLPRFIPSRPMSAVEAMTQLTAQSNPPPSASFTKKTLSPTKSLQQVPVKTVNPLKSRTFVPSRPVSAVQAMHQLQSYRPGSPPNTHGRRNIF